MKINRKFLIIVQIMLLSIAAYVPWANAQADGLYKITPTQASYSPQDAVSITFANLPTNNGDWIGIYPKNTNNDWANVVSWSYTNGTKSMATVGRSAGTLVLDRLAIGEYEARLFFNNSYQLEERVSFKVQKATSLRILESRVENINDSQVYVHFDLNQKAQGRVEYGTTTDYGQFTTKETSFQYASHRQLVSNLNPDALYHYRVHAYDENGVEVISDDKTFRINSSLEILSSRVETINDNSVYVHFDLNQQAQGQIEYGTTTNYGNFTTKETSFNYASHRQLVANIDPNALYHYRVHAFDEAGVAVVSEDKTFRINTLVYPPNTQFNRIPSANVQPPAKGGSYNDPRFLSIVTRVTDRASENCTYQNRKANCNAHPYPKTQAWNSDMSILKLGYRFYQADSLEELAMTKNINDASALYNLNGSLSEMKWSSVNPNVYYGIRGKRFVRATLNGNNIDTKVLVDFSANNYEQFLLGKFEGNIDFNDKYVAFAAKKSGENYLTAIVYNIQTNQVEAIKDLKNIAWPDEGQVFDWLSISPKGKYILVSATEPVKAIQQYDLKLNFIRQLTNSAGHGDLGIDVNNDEVYVQFEFGANNGIWSYRLKDGVRTRLLPDKYNGGHLSCRNYKRPGWCYLSTNSEGYKEVFALKIDNGSGTVQRFAQTHQERFSAVGVSPDGTRVLFNSDFGGASASKDTYMSYFE